MDITITLAQKMMQDSISMTHAAYSLTNRQFSLRLQNHTPHKLISGFPEGRRMFLNLKGYVNTQLVYHINPYDDSVGTLKGLAHSAASPPTGPGEEHHDALVYEVHHRSTLLNTNHTFHIVLATGREKDNRIPPRGFKIAEAASRLCEPVWHGSSDTNYFTTEEYTGGYDEVTVTVPPGIERVEAGLYYQTTSREFVEFLRDEINGTGGSLPGPGAGGDPAYLVQTDPWFSQLRAWGNTLWSLWDHNRHLPGAAPVLMTNTFVQLDITDTDLDGIPAYWESLYFNGATNASPDTDTDGDGMTDYAEYIALSNPTNKESFFAVSGATFERLPDGTSGAVSFTSHYARVYQLQVATNLLAPMVWIPRATAVPGSGHDMLLHDTNTFQNSFYRVKIALP